MKGFILSLTGNILFVNAAIVGIVGYKVVENPDTSNILQTVLNSSFGKISLTFLILACDAILTGIVFSIIGLMGNIKRNEKKLFNILGILIGFLPLLLLSTLVA